MNRMGWYLLSSRKELTRLSRDDLWHHYHHAYPHCHEDDGPYQKYGNHVCNERERQKTSYWLTGDPTFLTKLALHRKELYDKIVGAKDEGTGRNKSRRVAPPVGTGSSSSTARLLIATDLPLRLHPDIGVHGKEIAAAVGITPWPLAIL